MEVKNEAEMSGIPMMKEFMDVIPEGIPGLPPKKEVKFSNDLVPGVGPVLIGPYRMTSAELIKLKKQVEKLLKKRLIKLSIFSWGFQCCGFKRKMDDLGCVWTTGS